MKISIVNEQDEVIGYKERDDRNHDDIIRCSALWLTDYNGNIFIAQRAFTKKHSPGLWGPAVAGTVEFDETYESNIIKEAEEEIGLINIKPSFGPKVREGQYFVQWFTAVVNGDYKFIKQDDEVENIKWFSKEELLGLLKEKPEMFLPYFIEHINYFK